MVRFSRIALAALVSLIGMTVAAKEIELKTDVVVVGAGSAGLCAAVKAAEKGASVVVLEKLAFAGGSSNLAEGLFAVETNQQRLKAIGLTKEEAFKKAMEFNHFRANGALVSQTVERSAETIKWLEKQGVNFDVVSISPTEGPTWHLIQDYKGAHHGAAMTQALLARAKELGVTIQYETPAQSLISKDGKVIGVKAASKKDSYTISAKAVVIATGGFNNSPEMIRKYTRFNPEQVFATVPLNKVGDGIGMALSVGADSEGFGLMLHPGTQGKAIKPLGNIYAMTWQPTLWVNKYGDRFVDETVTSSFALAGNAIERQRGGFGWAIFDDETVKYAEENGIDNGLGVLVPIATKLTDLRAEFSKAIAAGSEAAFIADSVEDLAKKIGVPAGALKKTVDAFNTAKDIGNDARFHRRAQTINYVKSGKLYAIRIVPHNFVSIGGVKVSPNMETIDKNDQPISGLYTAGADVGGLFGDTYTLWTSGFMFQWSAQSGMIAGDSAAAYAKK